ncbi:MAG: NAD(P)H-dependent glycerol-3-phosphate dehydrogenase [Planctomycetota bacterium]
MNLAILGNGGFGIAMALVSHRAGHQVRVLGHDPEYTATIARTRRNPRYLPESAVIPDPVVVTADPAEALAGCEGVLVAVPTQHLREVLTQVRDRLPAGVPLVSLAKGLEQATGQRPSEILAETAGPEHPVLALSGPSHAEELAAGLPAAVVVAGAAGSGATALQAALGSAQLRVYRQHDLLGVELCGAVKNVMAIAAGVADGLGYGDNAKAAILARGVVEMARYGVAEGAESRTFFGMAGVGDLAVTAFSRHGRNRAFGERVGRGESLEQILASTHKVAEGVWTSRVVRDRAQRLSVEMPITDAVCAVLFEGLAPERAVRALMERDLKEESFEG